MCRSATHTRLARVALALLALAATDCGRLFLGGARALPECPGALRSTRDIEGDLRLELSLRVQADSVDTALRLALEKRGDRLTLVGLNPLGAVVFTVIQKGVDLEVEALPARLLDVPPENVLRDLHRALFLGISPPPGEGVHAALEDGTLIRETWSAGALRRRSFERPDGKPTGAVVVDFAPAPGSGLGRVHVHNGWCGYEATFVTLVREPPGSAGRRDGSFRSRCARGQAPPGTPGGSCRPGAVRGRSG